MLPAKSYFVWDAQGVAAWCRANVKTIAVLPCQAPDNAVYCIAQWHTTCGGIIVSSAAASGPLWVCVDPLRASSLCKSLHAPHAAWCPSCGFCRQLLCGCDCAVLARSFYPAEFRAWFAAAAQSV